MPNSSAATANTKSAWLSGRMRFTVPSPGPRPNQPPRRNEFNRGVDLERVARRRIEEALDAARDVRNRGIGDDQPERRDAAKPRHPHHPHPGHEEQRAPHQRDQHGLAEVGLQHQRRDGPISNASAMVLAGTSGLRADSANSHAIRMTNAGLRNSDG